MVDRTAVIEVIITAALRVAVPIKGGDDPHGAAVTVLQTIEGCRHVALEEIGDITPADGRLYIETYARITFHLNPKSNEDPIVTVRRRLEAVDEVDKIQNFQVESGPYRIESW